jgi:hypothetical protein
MFKVLQVAIATLVAFAASSGTTAAMPSLSNDDVAKIDTAVDALADAQARLFGSSVAFCAANQQSEGQPTDSSLSSFVEALKAGTKAGMIEIAASDRDILSSAPTLQGADFEMLDKQAATMLAAIQSSPVLGCKKLSTVLGSGTAETFKEHALESHRQYKARRAAYCARNPKPKNCD